MVLGIGYNSKIFDEKIGSFKLLTLVIGFVCVAFTLDVYRGGWVSSEIFLSSSIIILIISSVAFILQLLNYDAMKHIKKDTIFHLVSSVALLLCSIIFLFAILTNFGSKLKTTAWNTLKTSITIILGLLNSLIYATIALMLKRSILNESESEEPA